MPLPMGRGVSRIRTPLLIRDYLAGQGPFAEDPAEELVERLEQGAYVAEIHQRVKQYIRQLSKELRFKYQWPRRHSFNSRINDLLTLGLLVKTGEAAVEKVEPQQRGAGQLGSASRVDADGVVKRGFSLKLWVRLAPGADTRPEWADLMGYIDRYYAAKALAEGRPPPNIRPQRRELATALQQVAQAPQQLLRAQRQRRSAQALQAPSEALEAARQLEERRDLLKRTAETLEISGINANSFENLVRNTGEFHAQVLRLYTRTPFPDLPEALELLQNCVQRLQAETEMTQRRVQAVNNCRSSARLVAEALAIPLGPPEAAPAVVEPAPPAATRPRRARRAGAAAPAPIPAAPVTVRETAEEVQHQEDLLQLRARLRRMNRPVSAVGLTPEPSGVTDEDIEQIKQGWAAVADRINGWSRPNSVNAGNLLDRFVQEMVEAHPEILEDDLDSAIADVRSGLEAYQEEEDPDEKAGAWEGFTEALGEVDFSGLSEE